MEQVKMTDTERLIDIQKRIHRLEVLQLIKTGIVVLGFIGILSLPDVIKAMRK